MIVCVCHRVSDRDIAHEVHAGCSSFAQLQAETRVATGCGACKDCARSTFEACQRSATPHRAQPHGQPLHYHLPMHSPALA